MKKILLLSLALLLGVTLSAQTQQGYVKTKGRMVNGKLVPGQGLKGATVSIKGRNVVLVNADDGAFSFPVPKEKKYHIDSVKKKEYELVNYTELRTHTYSGDTLFLIMEKPAQQQADILAKERNLRRQSEAKLQRLEDSISSLNISLEEKNHQLEELSQQREFNENYIKELAKYSASLDYDRISEFQRQVNASLEEGEFGKALQLLRSKGNITDLLKTIQQEETAEAQKDIAIQKEIEDNEKAKAVTSLKKEELGQICYSYYQTHLMQHHFDSAAYYIEFRTIVDTTNAQWLYDAAFYFSYQNNTKLAIYYYEKALSIFRKMDLDDIQSYGVDMAYTLINLAQFYSDTKPSTLSQCESMYKEAIDISDELIYSNNPEGYAIKFNSLNNLMSLYNSNSLYSEAEQVFLDDLTELMEEVEYDSLVWNNPNMVFQVVRLIENGINLANKASLLSPERANQIIDRNLSMSPIDNLIELAEEEPETFGPLAIRFATLYADLHMQANHLSESESLLKKTIEIARKLVQVNSEAFSPGLIQQLHALGNFYKYANRMTESEALYVEALEICRQLVKKDTNLFTPFLADVLNDLGILYGMIGYANQDLNELLKSEAYLKESLEKGRILVKMDPQRFESGLCNGLSSLGDLYMTFCSIYPDSDSYEKSEALYLEAIELMRPLADNNPKYHALELCSTIKKLGALYYSLGIQKDDEKMFGKCKQCHLEVLDIVRKLDKSEPLQYEAELIGALADLGNLCRNLNEFDQCETYYEEAIILASLLDDENNNYIYGHADLLYNAAQYKGMVEQYEEGIEMVQESMELCKSTIDDNPETEMLYLYDLSLLATLYTSHMDYNKAQAVYQELLPLLQSAADIGDELMKQQYAIDLGSASFCALLTSQLEEAEQHATKALSIDPSQHWISTNLAAALLFQGKYDEAEQIYRQFKNELKDNFLQDLNEFEAAGVIPEERKADVERIRKMLNE